MWDERYGSDDAVFGFEPNRFIAEELKELHPRRVLDLGSGQGRNALWLASQGHTVTAVDLSPVGVAQMVEAAAYHGVAIDGRTADLTTWEPPPGAFDLVVLSYLQVVPIARSAIHRRAIDALAPGGEVLLIAHHLDNLTRGVGGPQLPEFLFTEELLRDDFSELIIDRLETVHRPTPEGTAIDVLLRAHRGS